MLSATLRDIAIILIAVQTILINLLLVILIWQIWRLVRMVQRELKPIIEDTQETVGTVRGTATFVSDHMVSPMVKSAGTVARWRRTLQVLTADLRSVRPRKP